MLKSTGWAYEVGFATDRILSKLMTATGKSMLNSGLLLYLLLLINPGRYKVCSKTIEFLSSELASVSRRHPSLKCTNDLQFFC